MVSLTDIAPSTRSVRVGGKDATVYGVGVKGIAALLRDFPDLQKLMTGQKVDLTAGALMDIAPDAIAAIMAAGLGFPGDKDAIKAVEALPLGEQVKILEATIELTMPDGIGPFVDALNALMARLNFDALGKAPDSNSPLPSKT